MNTSSAHSDFTYTLGRIGILSLFELFVNGGMSGCSNEWVGVTRKLGSKEPRRASVQFFAPPALSLG